MGNNKKIDAVACSTKDTINMMIRKKQKEKTASKKTIVKESQGTVPLNLVVDNPFQPRIDYDMDYIKGLAATIKRDGLLQPIVVTPRDGKYILVGGHQRKIAHDLLEKMDIEAIVREGLTDEDLMILGGIENIKRKNLSALEEGKYFYDLTRNGFTVKEIAERFSEDEAEVSRKKNLLKLGSEILEDLRLNKSTNDVKALTALRKIEDEQKQFALYKGLLENGREWLLSEIVLATSKGAKKPDAPYTLKNNKITVDLKKVGKDKAKRIEEAIKSILSE
jgi:ParB family chromosome partitioning protein